MSRILTKSWRLCGGGIELEETASDREELAITV